MEDVYALFSDVLQQAQSGDLSVLDEEEGLIVKWSEICQQRLDEFAGDSSPEQLEAWTLERNTWQLVQALYSERLAAAEIPQGSTSKNPYTPPLSVAQKFIESRHDLVELSAIRDWLHAIPTSLNPAEIRRGYLPYTKNKLKHARRIGGQYPPRGLVSELDPDATLREGLEGGRLEDDDATYERALLRSLFEYVRAGDLDLAIDMCRQSDQSWRAASLSGGQLWSDPVLSHNDAFADEMDLVEEDSRRAKGTLNRRLWKRMCRKLAATPGLDQYERALYGAISGDTTSVLPVCTSWEDIVWTHVNALFEANVEAGLWASSEGRYWSRGAVKAIGGDIGIDSEDPLMSAAAGPGGVRRQLEALFDRLMRADKMDVAMAAKNPYHVSQSYLIVDKISELFTSFVDRLEVAATETEPETLAHLLRFLAHLVLALRLMQQPVPEFAANRILEAYVNVLEANDQDESLIAFYASNLDSSSAVESYARFLLTFGPESDRQSRKVALLKTHEHGLDLAKIACRTVELVLEDVREDMLDFSFGGAFDAYARLDARQLELIRSLEWLTFDPSTYSAALSQANALARHFLATDKPHAARELLLQLPADLLSSSAVSASEGVEDGSQIREYLDYESLFGCLEKHSSWAEVWARKPVSSAPKLDQTAFRDGVATLVDDFYNATMSLLESDWLKLEIPEDVYGTGRRRATEFAHIRKLVVPHLVFRLHHTLFATRDILPLNLERALGLANTVADERYRLYVEFVSDHDGPEGSGNQIGEYLAQVRLASLAALGQGKNAFGLERK